MVGPKPPKPRNAAALYHAGQQAAIQSALRGVLGREPSAQEVADEAHARFQQLSREEMDALAVASVQEGGLRARESLLWEGEVAEAAAVVELCLHTKVALDAHRQRAGAMAGRAPTGIPSRAIGR